MIKAAVIAAFTYLPLTVLAQDDLPVDLSCKVLTQNISLQIITNGNESVTLTVESARGNRMRSTVSGSSRASMMLSKTQFPVTIMVDTVGKNSVLTVTDDCQITHQTPHS
ncbi:hypothetical protein L6J37_03685 [Photobacterium sp. WH77]|uniref:hypothetical protein n=1 Tax=unclassified Photobacterium TaxID=2628852 RepID=UPI001EDC47F4|nr:MULTISPECIES: hypothetical protein [unclassified Photobacterium]MCG2835961.1 hypothetical protein [Photobacterium sp. WH77]MCG2843362.1 hypothetical protein [Photobacterium sp. WH80]